MSKLERKNSSSGKRPKFSLNNFIYQISLTIIYSIAVYRVHTIIIPLKNPRGYILGKFKYLTTWNLHFQLLNTLLNVLLLFVNSSKLNFILINLRNLNHHALSVPFGFSVSILYWGLFLINHKLVVPERTENYSPYSHLISPMNHILHTLVIITPIINEIILYNQRKSYHIYIYLIVFILYGIQLLFIGYYLDYWAYPIFEKLNHLGKFSFLSFSILFGLVIYLIHGFIHSSLWEEKIKKSKESKGKNSNLKSY